MSGGIKKCKVPCDAYHGTINLPNFTFNPIKSRNLPLLSLLFNEICFIYLDLCQQCHQPGTYFFTRQPNQCICNCHPGFNGDSCDNGRAYFQFIIFRLVRFCLFSIVLISF